MDIMRVSRVNRSRKKGRKPDCRHGISGRTDAREESECLFCEFQTQGDMLTAVLEVTRPSYRATRPFDRGDTIEIP